MSRPKASPPTTDLIAVLPGIMGSTLGRATKDKLAKANLVWAPTTGAAIHAARNFLGHAPQLILPDGIGDNPAVDGVEPIGLMPDLHVIPGLWTPIRGYATLINFLNRLGYHHQPTTRPPNLLLVPYDWRLSNRYNGHRLAGVVEPALDRWRAQGGRYQDAQVVFICHSMGGLVARWYIEKCGGAEHTRKFITLGTPWRGAAVALDKLCNGVAVKIGPINKLNLDAFARSLPSLYQLLPEYACIQSGQNYIKITETVLPVLDTTRVADGMSFHTSLQEAERQRPASRLVTHMLIGARQPTTTTFKISNGVVAPSETFGTVNEFGDGTVPLSGAVGHDQPPNSNLIKRVVDQHGNLQCNAANCDEIQEIITATTVRRRADQPYGLRVTLPDLIAHGEALPVIAKFDGDYWAGLTITVKNEAGHTVRARQPRIVNGEAHAEFTDLPPAGYTITVDGTHFGGPVSPVTACALVWIR